MANGLENQKKKITLKRHSRLYTFPPSMKRENPLKKHQKKKKKQNGFSVGILQHVVKYICGSKNPVCRK